MQLKECVFLYIVCLFMVVKQYPGCPYCITYTNQFVEYLSFCLPYNTHTTTKLLQWLNVIGMRLLITNTLNYWQTHSDLGLYSMWHSVLLHSASWAQISTDRQTDVIKRIISLALRSIINHCTMLTANISFTQFGLYTATRNLIFTKSYHTRCTYQHLAENRNLYSIFLEALVGNIMTQVQRFMVTIGQSVSPTDDSRFICTILAI